MHTSRNPKGIGPLASLVQQPTSTAIPADADTRVLLRTAPPGEPADEAALDACVDCIKDRLRGQMPDRQYRAMVQAADAWLALHGRANAKAAVDRMVADMRGHVRRSNAYLAYRLAEKARFANAAGGTGEGSRENPVVLYAHSPLEAITQQFRWLRSHWGQQGVTWTLRGRERRIDGQGREIEALAIRTAAAGDAIVCFDVTGVAGMS